MKNIFPYTIYTSEYLTGRNIGWVYPNNDICSGTILKYVIFPRGAIQITTSASVETLFWIFLWRVLEKQVIGICRDMLGIFAPNMEFRYVYVFIVRHNLTNETKNR